MGDLSRVDGADQAVDAMKKVWHFYANRTNMGDWASALGVRQFLDAASSEPIEYVDHFLLDPVTNEEFDRMNQTADMVVIGGGGTWFRKDTPSGWMLNMRPELLRRLRPPLAIFGVGLNDQFDRTSDWSLDAPSIANILETVDRACCVGVRDAWTLNWLREQGVTNAKLAPCPSMLLECKADSGARRSNLVGVNTVSTRMVRHPNRLLRLMSKTLARLCENGFTPVYMCQGDAANDLTQALHARFPGEMIVPKSPVDLLRAYGRVRFMIAMRAHSLLLAFNRDTPSFCISYNKKCESFLKLLEADDYRLDWDFGPVSVWNPRIHRTVWDGVQSLMAHENEIRSRWKDLRERFRVFCRDFAEEIVAAM